MKMPLFIITPPSSVIFIEYILEGRRNTAASRYTYIRKTKVIDSFVVFDKFKHRFMCTLYKKHKTALIFMLKYAIIIVPHNQIILFKLSFVFLFR